MLPPQRVPHEMSDMAIDEEASELAGRNVYVATCICGYFDPEPGSVSNVFGAYTDHVQYANFVGFEE